jgi:hypothetical protein
MLKYKLIGLVGGVIGSYFWVYNPNCSPDGCPLTSKINFSSIRSAMTGYLLGGFVFEMVNRKK